MATAQNSADSNRAIFCTHRVVLDPPWKVLTVTIAPHDDGFEVTWTQQFEDAAVAARIRHIVEPANEQNLDRLVSVLSGL